jgi:DNA transformation protein
MVTDDYRTFVLEQLRRATPAVLMDRAMFGGVGVYADGVFFALMADDVLYFKVDDTNRGDFKARGMGPFLPYGDPDRPMQYYEVPGDLLEDPAELGAWVERAVAVARSKKARGSRGR